MNTHPMQTRYKYGIFRSIIHLLLFLSHSEPTSAKQELKDVSWLVVMQQEYNALMHQNTWDLVSLSPQTQVVDCKWVFKVKKNAYGSINNYKARLVAKEFHQVLAFDFHETLFPIVKPITIRIFLPLAISHECKLFQLDFNNAFLNGFLKEIFYMTQPPGFEVSDKSLVCKLKKALYDLK